jgi:hypothetical protein
MSRTVRNWIAEPWMPARYVPGGGKPRPPTGGWLVVYDSRFRGDPSRPELLDWLTGSYWGRLAWVGRNPLFDPSRHAHPTLRVCGRGD